ncbi:MAG: hypothetical protein KBF25_01835, partial [Chitinophagaceae bacterium]|nr:hypothetical protein [Chitinophagaceae bacterium]
KPIIEEDILTDFDLKMIEEMKTIPQLKHWTDEQLRQYCLVLHCYSKMTLSIIENEKQLTTSLTFNRTILKQVA